MTASTGRTQDCTRPTRQKLNSPLAMREPSTQDVPYAGISAAAPKPVAYRGRRLAMERMFVATSPSRCSPGLRSLARRPSTSRRAHRGRTALSKASMRDCGMNSKQRYFLPPKERQSIIESWRRHHNTIRPHGALDYKPPALELFVPAMTAGPTALTRLALSAKLYIEQRPTLR